MSVCPYCRSEIDQGGGVTCEGCGTPHHVECLEENGGCTLFGCTLAPPDDPKLQVTSGDVSRAAVFGAAPPYGYAPRTGFGDVSGPIAVVPAMSAETPPPPPPPPGMEMRPAVETSVMPVGGTLFAQPELKPKSRLTYILLGIFLGSFGVHNFYAGYIARGLAQLALTVFTLFYASVVTWIWALVEVCMVDRDKHGTSFV
jgi:TM2 domain-containing membrane protein YozV